MPKILVVDDNEDLTQTFRWMLEAMEHKVIVAHSGMEAIALAREEAPDVVLLDLGLPDMDGFEACRRLREIPHMTKSYFVAQTGRDSAEDRNKAESVGFDQFIVKPVPFEQLEALLKTHCVRSPGFSA